MIKLCLPSNKTNYGWVHLMQSYSKYVAETSIVLEIGASNVGRTKMLSQLCRELYGIEFVPEKKPNNFDNVKNLIGDWQYLSEFIQPNSIDVAVSSHVIEHVPEDLKAINELYSVLKVGGGGVIEYS